MLTQKNMILCCCTAHFHLTSGSNHFQIFDLQAVTRFLYPLYTPRKCRAETRDWTVIAQLRLFSHRPGELPVPYIYILHVVCPLVPSACSPRFSRVCCVSSLTAATTCVAILPQHLPACGTRRVFGKGAAAVKTLALALA